MVENSLPVDPLELTGVYRECYNQIVKPHRIFSVTRYFLQRWVQILGPSAAWLVVDLRQYAYWNGRRDWCQVSADQVANDLGLHRQRVFEMLNTPWVDWFVWRHGEPHYTIRQDTGRISRSVNRYKVALSDPLVPADAEHLTSWLAETADAITGEPLKRAMTAVRAALEISRDDLLAPTPGPASTDPDFFHGDSPPDILDLVIRAVPDLRSVPMEEEGWVELSEHCDSLYDHLTEPKAQVLDSQYFRLQWVPRLGAGAAWLVFYLRSLGYCNEERGIFRDSIWISELGALAQVLGASKDTLARSWLKAAGKGGETWRMDWFVKLLEKQKGRDPNNPQQVALRFRVALRDPLTPGDQARYEELLTARLIPADTAKGIAGESGRTAKQGKRRIRTHAPQVTGDSGPTKGKESGKSGHTKPRGHRESRTHGLEVEGVSGPTGIEVSGDSGRERAGSQEIPDKLKYYKHIVEHVHEKEQLDKLIEAMQQQQDLPNANDKPFAAVVAPDLECLLQKLQILGQPRQDILDHDPPVRAGDVLAWHLFAVSEPGLNRNKIGYVVERVRSGDPPPMPFAQLVYLSWISWRMFSLANQLFVDNDLIIPSQFREVHTTWCTVYGGLRPDELPWGVGEGIMDVVADWSTLFTSALSENADDQDLGPAMLDTEVALEDGRSVACGKVWDTALEQLRLQMTKSTFDSYLVDSEVVAFKEDRFEIKVTTAHAQAWLDARLRPVVAWTMEAVVGRPVEIEFVA